MRLGQSQLTVQVWRKLLHRGHKHLQARRNRACHPRDRRGLVKAVQTLVVKHLCKIRSTGIFPVEQVR
jgi:hypothetical protein